MNRKQLVFSLLICLFACTNGFSQTTLVCNDLVSITLDQACTHTIEQEEILEGTFCLTCDYEVTLDKTAPFGNGPWVPAVLGIADMGETYTARVRDPATGNACWGNVEIVEELDCRAVTTVNLNGGTAAGLLPADLQVNFTGNCLPLDLAGTTMNNGQPSVTYGCNDLGVHILQVTAGDQGGNTATCYTTVVVDDPGSECSSCITCPQATSVTFDEGGGTLLPAYQSGNLAAFDAYGDAAYGACAFEDSTYVLAYNSSPYGQNWFIRTWEGKDDAGQVIASCQQVITFPFYQNIAVSGKVFLDSLPDCQHTAGEPGVAIFDVVAVKLPSNEQIAVTPGPDGAYAFNLEVNSLDTLVRMQYALPAGLSSTCPTTLDIPIFGTTQAYTFDIGLQAEAACPLLQVSMGAPFVRRCMNNYFTVQYCNTGFLTAEAAYVTVEFDPLYAVVSSTIPWTGISGNLYTFALGDIPALTCGTFNVTALLSCDAVLSQTICNGVTIYPHEPCGEAAWDGPYIETTATCNGDTVLLSVWNTGAQAMPQEKQYIVIEDVIMYREGHFQLAAGDSITIKMPANGATWRIEAEQASAYPFPDEPSASVESCNGLNTPGLVNAFPQNDEMLFYDRACEEVIGSYDPNDKSAVPTGYGAAHTIRANTGLEYKIRFQNTGTDTAFRIVIVDTLSTLLDPATIEAGASSHPYRLDVYPGGILHFVFDPIMLPDSNINELASHGFVKFRIAQQPNLPDGTVLTNQAAIYFDFNDPVITNTVWHTIGAPFVAVQVDEPDVPGVQVNVRPNPFRDQTVIQVSGTAVKQGVFTLYDAQGRTVYSQSFQGNQFEFARNNLPQGLYFFRISEGGKALGHGKLQAY